MKRKARKVKKSFWELIILLSAILTIFITLPDPAMAGNSITLIATCTIPSIPGVNAPMLEKQSMSNPAEAQKATAEESTANAQNPLREQLPTIMQEEATRQAPQPMAPNAAAAPMLTRTLYSR